MIEKKKKKKSIQHDNVTKLSFTYKSEWKEFHCLQVFLVYSSDKNSTDSLFRSNVFWDIFFLKTQNKFFRVGSKCHNRTSWDSVLSRFVG